MITYQDYRVADPDALETPTSPTKGRSRFGSRKTPGPTTDRYGTPTASGLPTPRRPDTSTGTTRRGS